MHFYEGKRSTVFRQIVCLYDFKSHKESKLVKRNDTLENIIMCYLPCMDKLWSRHFIAQTKLSEAMYLPSQVQAYLFIKDVNILCKS